MLNGSIVMRILAATFAVSFLGMGWWAGVAPPGESWPKLIVAVLFALVAALFGKLEADDRDWTTIARHDDWIRIIGPRLDRIEALAQQALGAAESARTAANLSKMRP